MNSLAALPPVLNNNAGILVSNAEFISAILGGYTLPAASMRWIASQETGRLMITVVGGD